MRNLRLATLLAVASIGLCALAEPQTTRTLYSLQDQTASQVIATKKLTFHDTFGVKGFDVDGWAFGGFEYSAGQPLTGGVAASIQKDVSREAFADLGIYARATQREKVDFGLFFGLGFKLSKPPSEGRTVVVSQPEVH